MKFNKYLSHLLLAGAKHLQKNIQEGLIFCGILYISMSLKDQSINSIYWITRKIHYPRACIYQKCTIPGIAPTLSLYLKVKQRRDYSYLVRREFIAASRTIRDRVKGEPRARRSLHGSLLHALIFNRLDGISKSCARWSVWDAYIV